MPLTTVPIQRGPHARPVGSHRTASEVDWRHQAVCRDEDPELFFPVDEDGESEAGRAQIAAAKAVCGRCQVREACLADTLARGTDFGISGGLTAAERRAYKAVAA